ncbi:hypothetical protein [Ideonella sp. A 288]|uniref:hypothetical protein n=1 Tax=Ideonella sp. A 288 TaxID=1962181 RepID=UPI000B4B27A0|nr:hypothetical protein [Ideonella sp. A 288]
MKKTALTLVLLTTATLASAQSWRFLPLFTDPGYKAQPTLALTVDSVNPDGARDATGYGLEFNFNCGLIQSPDNRIRTYSKLHRSSEDGLKATTFELSPRYMLPLGGGLSAGAGPSLTAVRVSAPGVSKTLYGAGLAAGVDWRSGAYYVGADVRWHDVRQKNGIEYDNTAVGLKVGMNF